MITTINQSFLDRLEVSGVQLIIVYDLISEIESSFITSLQWAVNKSLCIRLSGPGEGEGASYPECSARYCLRTPVSSPPSGPKSGTVKQSREKKRRQYRKTTGKIRGDLTKTILHTKVQIK